MKRLSSLTCAAFLAAACQQDPVDPAGPGASAGSGGGGVSTAASGAAGASAGTATGGDGATSGASNNGGSGGVSGGSGASTGGATTGSGGSVAGSAGTGGAAAGLCTAGDCNDFVSGFDGYLFQYPCAPGGGCSGEMCVGGALTITKEFQVKGDANSWPAMATDAAPTASSPPTNVQRGDLFWVAPAEARGGVPSVAHPHLVLQDDVFNRSRVHTVIVCALTTNLSRANEPGNVLLEVGEGSLPRQSVLVVSQVSSVARTELGPYIGALSSQRVEQVLDGMRFQQASFFNR